MAFIELSDIDDPRLHVYRHLKKTNRTRWSSQFIAEGKKLVVQLLKSEFVVQSIMTSDKHVAYLEPHVPDEIPAYVLPHSRAQSLVGYAFHCGMLGCGIRKPARPLDDLLDTERRHLLVVLPRTENPENMGSIIRIAAGFGATAVLTGQGCCDPFSRRALRVSMGNTFCLPVIETGTDLAGTLRGLKEQYSCELFAILLDESAEPLSKVTPSGNCALLFGHEDSGLTLEWISLCDRRITIPMHGDTDSLNVAVAAGIFLHHFANVIQSDSAALTTIQARSASE